MQATYRTSEQDYINAMWLFSRPTRRKLTVLIGIAALLLIIATSKYTEWRSVAVALLVGGLVSIVSSLCLLPYRARRHYRLYKAMQGEFGIELQEDGLRCFSSQGDSKITWSRIHKWRQNECYVLIYTMPKLFYILPKTVAADGFDLALLISKLQQHAGNES